LDPRILDENQGHGRPEYDAGAIAVRARNTSVLIAEMWLHARHLHARGGAREAPGRCYDRALCRVSQILSFPGGMCNEHNR